MTLHIPAGFAQCSIKLTHASMPRPMYVTFGVDGTSASPLPSNWPASVLNAFKDAFLSSVDTNVTVGPAYLLVGTGGAENEPYTGGTPAAGTRGIIGPAASTAVLYEKVTARPGRRGKGRMYMPFVLLATDVLETGAILPASVPALVGLGTTLLSELEETGRQLPMVVLHNKTDPPEGSPPPDLTPNRVTTFNVDPVVGIQRRRLGRGF